MRGATLMRPSAQVRPHHTLTFPPLLRWAAVPPYQHPVRGATMRAVSAPPSRVSMRKKGLAYEYSGLVQAASAGVLPRDQERVAPSHRSYGNATRVSAPPVVFGEWSAHVHGAFPPLVSSPTAPASVHHAIAAERGLPGISSQRGPGTPPFLLSESLPKRPFTSSLLVCPRVRRHAPTH